MPSSRRLAQLPPRASYDSEGTASDATMEAEEAEKTRTLRYRDEDSQEDDDTVTAKSRNTYPPNRLSSLPARSGNIEDEEEEDANHLRLNDDEEVGLMQAERDGLSAKRTPAWATRLGGLAKRRTKGSRSAGCLIFIGVIFGFVLGLPLLQWLASSTSGVTEAAKLASSPSPSSSSATQDLTSSPNSSTSTIWKYPASNNDESGHYALSNQDIFKLAFQDPGWENAKQAAAGTGLTEQEVTSFKNLMPLDMDTVFGGTLEPQTSDLSWSEEDPDEGVFTHVDWSTRDIWLEDVTHARHQKTGEGKVAPFGGKVRLLEGKNVLDTKGQMLSWTSFKISPDMKWVLFFTQVTQQWRYSQKSHLWLHDIHSKQTRPLGTTSTQAPKVSYAAWAPKKTGVSSSDPPSLAFVEDNNLHFIARVGMDEPVNLTNDGAATIFNAVPDWVYEEEVFGQEYTMWFSPGGTKLVYLRLDETSVPVYEFPIYNPNPYLSGKTTPYQKTTKMKYPKPGYPNPIVSVHMIDLDQVREAVRKGGLVKPMRYTLHSPTTNKGKTDNDVDKLLSSDQGVKQRIVTEVKWVSDDQLLVRETDRYSDVMRVVLFDMEAKNLSGGPTNADGTKDIEGKVVRRQDARADKSGWIRASQTIEPLSHHDLSVGSTAYLDILVSSDGYRHLAYFESATADRPIFLTSGKWEIDTLNHVDATRGKAYFIAARPTPALRNLYSVELPDWKQPGSAAKYKAKEPTALTDVGKPGSYDANFDPKGAYYVLNYKGPDVPYQKVVGVDDTSFFLDLETNTLLRQISSQYVKPSNTFYDLVLNNTLEDGTPVMANVKEIRPHDFDGSGTTKYPVLIRVYGGPDSQMVDARWNRADWHQYVASTLGYVVVVVDGRGTGFKGQKYRSAVARQLGHVEAIDVNNAAELISHLPYVDETRIGLWGWSFGGFLTAKSVEQNSGIFSVAVSVAPVTKWEFYDSIYTERYMKDPKENRRGYSSSEIHVDGGGFTQTKYLLMQGSADDNVHFSNSAHLLDLLTKAKVRGFRFRMFPDSAHSISVRGAWRELFEEMTSFLKTNWGPGGKRGPKSPAGKKGKDRQSLHNSVE